MKQVIKILRKSDLVKLARDSILADQDYYLDSLNYARKNNDEAEIKRCERRLFEISVELKGLDMHEQLQ
ncbi:UDP-N-acetylglucosamine 2-epimerase [Solibacillus silvestris StLB046]|uniref:UDP-N-acetylglucosamine 2-epimerase n=1 Tax=Solibacillus silvestris (strain StLB046) TaxID=1002809 RepID=F2F2H9_SOLSS|nr:hypothetical protein [Solibacillus silvestris]BAK15817.1 UDP-N-acetylglucosamine 2-epimerase [Solibacillus silvestris StLB046]